MGRGVRPRDAQGTEFKEAPLLPYSVPGPGTAALPRTTHTENKNKVRGGLCSGEACESSLTAPRPGRWVPAMWETACGRRPSSRGDARPPRSRGQDPGGAAAEGSSVGNLPDSGVGLFILALNTAAHPTGYPHRKFLFLEAGEANLNPKN